MNNQLPVTWIAQGEPEEYVIFKDGRWFCFIQFNGELSTFDQEQAVNNLTQSLEEGNFSAEEVDREKFRLSNQVGTLKSRIRHWSDVDNSTE